MNAIPHPVILEGKLVRLEPLAQEHYEALVQCGKDERIWQHMTIVGNRREEMLAELRSAVLTRSDGSQYPFVIIDKESGTPIGSTRFFDIHLQHKKLEIGYTWYHPDYWGKGHNTECKFLLLQFCFETLGLNRVQLKTRDNNFRSQAAIKGIGGKYEGTLRKDRVMPSGEVRDSMMFSIINDEWPEVKTMLEEKMIHVS